MVKRTVSILKSLGLYFVNCNALLLGMITLFVA
jgi:hypothetical protein